MNAKARSRMTVDPAATDGSIHHDHGGGHAHRVTASADRRRLLVALGLIVAFMVGEVIAGVLSHSLALLSDAGHMLTDAGALGLSIVVIQLAARPPAGGLTYGLKRAEILSGLANGTALFALAALIVYEAARRLVSPPSPSGWPIVVVAAVGVAVNLLATSQLAHAEGHSLNIRGSYQHLLTDMYAFIATALAGVVILVSGFTRADAIASLVIAGLMLRAAYGLVHEAGGVLLEAAPRDMDADAVARAITSVPHVSSLHDFHLWEITSGEAALSAHVLVPEGDDCHACREDIETMLRERFGLHHTTLQVDHANEPFVPLESVRGGSEGVVGQADP